MRWSVSILGALVIPLVNLAGQQLADTSYSPHVSRAAFPANSGPLVLLDEAHHNFHTLDGRYAPFARLLRSDGFVVAPNRESFTVAGLGRAKVLVIANAAPDTSDDWILPTAPAFSPAEVATVARWVREGGSLLLIADHMPFAGAAEELAAAFGIAFMNGFALTPRDLEGRYVFRHSDQSLGADVITAGARAEERVDSIVSFTGQVFRVIRPVRALMTVDSSLTLFFPTRAWQFPPQTPRVAAAGLLQGAVFRHGRGRVAVFGEAAMFSAQVAGPQRRPMGMNDPGANQNAQFALNVLHWLVHRLEPE